MSSHPQQEHQTPADRPSPRRRRLIQLGAGTLPVALTLASRPVFAAGQCNTTSAWGSAQMQAATGSAAARLSQHLLSAEGWSIAQWATAGGAGWATIGSKRYGQSTDTASYAQARLLVSDLFGRSVGSAAPSTNVFSYLAGKGTTDFGACLIAAKLNLLYGSSNTGLASCLSPNGDAQAAADVLNRMADVDFAPGSGSKPWSADQITLYLVKNNIVS